LIDVAAPPRDPAGPRAAPARGPAALVAAVGLAFLGLLVSLALAYRAAHPASTGFCGPGSGCDAVLESRFATVGGVPLSWLGAGYFAALLVGYLVAYARRGGPAYRVAVRAAGWVALAGTLVSGLLLYVQFGVIGSFCPLCTATTVLAAAGYVVGGAVPKDGEPAGKGTQAAVLGLTLAVVGLVAGGAFLLGRRGEVVARIDGRELTADDLRRELQFSLHAIEHQAFQAKLDWVERKVADRVLEAEAKRRGLGVDELLAKEVDAGAEPSDAEVDAFLARRAASVPEEERRERVRRAIRSERRGERLKALVQSLRAGHRVDVFLDVPKAPLVNVDLSRARREGPERAPVSLVLFSDFQCPHCATLATTVRRVRERFPKEVSLAFLHGPLEAHDRAEPAAVAAECAAEQGRFREYHDLLFGEPGELDDAALVAHAKALGLDLGAFDACRRGSAAAERVRANRRQAQSLGISSMPSLFLNGRIVGGSIEYGELVRLVEEELRNPWLPGR
jgi:protein-disulfide isomerase/uncharacterized membrane protein